MRVEAFVTKRINLVARKRAYRPERFLTKESPRESGATQVDRLGSWTSSCDSWNSDPSLSPSHISEIHTDTQTCPDAILLESLGIRVAFSRGRSDILGP
jgi:hypothetical protein